MEHGLPGHLPKTELEIGIGARLVKLEEVQRMHAIQTAVRVPGDGPSLWPEHCPVCGMDFDDQATMIVCDTCFNEALDARCSVLLEECGR